jgi:hypothetical protein
MIGVHRFARVACCLVLPALAACAKKDNAAVDTSAAAASSTAAAPAPAAPTPINLADVAGKWNMRSVPTTGDTTATTFVLTATGTPDGWTITFPGRPPVAEHVTVSGDSVLVESDTYNSVRRKGVKVKTTGTLRLQGGNIVGHNTAHYAVKTADSVLMLNTTGTRAK